MVYLHGRGLPLEDEALYYTLPFCLYHRHSHTYHMTIPNYLIIYFFMGVELSWGLSHIAGRGLTLIDEALYYTFRFPLYHRHSPYLPRYLCLIIYIFIYFLWAMTYAGITQPGPSRIPFGSPQ
jgi:hypothetical protein